MWRPESDLPRSTKGRSGLRFYSPKLGRWVSRDPIEDVGPTLYGFVGNDGIDVIDVFGLYSLVFQGAGWTLDRQSKVQLAFNSLDSQLPSVMSTMGDLLDKASQLPCCCAYRTALERELDHLGELLDESGDGLSSSDALRLRIANVDGDFLAAYTWSWFGAVSWIEFNTHPSCDYFAIPDSPGPGTGADKESTLLHELSHKVGDTVHDDSGGWWLNADHVETVLLGDWWVDLRSWLIMPSGVGLGEVGCPTGPERWPNNPPASGEPPCPASPAVGADL
jgi:hypothetical protein